MQTGSTLFVELVEKEDAELRPGHAGAGVCDRLHHFAQIEFGRDRGRDFVQALSDRIFFLQRLLFLPALGHVVKNHDRANDFALRTLDRRRAVLDRNFRPVPPHEDGMIRQALSLSASSSAPWIGFDTPPARFLFDQMEHVIDRTPHGFRSAPAAQLFSDRIQECDAAIVIYRNDRVANTAERDAEPLALLAQFGFRHDPLRDIAEAPDSPDVAVFDPLDFGNPLNDSAIDQLEKIMSFGRPLLVDLFDPCQKRAGIRKLGADDISQLLM